MLIGRSFNVDHKKHLLGSAGRAMARIIAGEACTELGCDRRHTARASWLRRWAHSFVRR